MAEPPVSPTERLGGGAGWEHGPGGGSPSVKAPGIALLAVGSIGAVSLVAASFHFTASTGWAFFLFVAATFGLVYAPGSALLRLLRLELAPLDRAALSLVLGLVLGSGVYWICARSGQRLALWLWPLLGLLLWARAAWGRPHRLPRPRWPHVGLAVAMLLGLLPLLLVPIYFRNLAKLPDGGLSYYPLGDVLLHLGLARELGRSVPAQIPYLPGVPSRYHIGMDLLAALMASVPGLDVTDVTLRFVPVLLVIAGMLSVFTFGRAFLGSETGAVALVVLVFLGGDLSYLPGLLLRPDQPWVVYFFGTPTVVSLYLLNPLLPSLSILFAGLLCLLRYSRGEPRAARWGLPCAVLIVALAEYKVFALPHLLASLALGAAVWLARRRDPRLLRLLLFCLLLLAPLAWQMVASGVAERSSVRLEAWPYVPAALVRCGLLATAFGQAALGHLQGRPGLWPALAFWLLAVPGYLLGSLGMRAVGLPIWLRDLVRLGPDVGGRFVVAVFVGLGPLITLSFAVTPADSAPGAGYNNAVWFVVYSKLVAWVFAVGLLLSLRSASRRALALVLLVALSLPSTVQYFRFQLREGEMQRLSADEVEAFRALERLSRPGDVVLARERLAFATVVLTHCRAQVLDAYTSFFLAKAELVARVDDQRRFFEAWRAGDLRRDILDRGGVRFVVVEGEDRHGPIEPAFANATVQVYEVAAGAGGGP